MSVLTPWPSEPAWPAEYGIRQCSPGVSALRGRLAPSPTGLLHLGNAWAFLCAWLGARSTGGSLVLRLEDIDRNRSKEEFAGALQEDLLWLGLDWDEGPYRQSLRISDYAAVLEDFKAENLVYPCFCTRKELHALAGAPHGEDRAGIAAEGSYPGFCRHLSAAGRESRIAAGRGHSWRLRFDYQDNPDLFSFTDLVLGRVTLTAEQAAGDFPLCRSDGVFAYQLAVVLDDLSMGVTQVVRGADILPSTPRQLYLYQLLGAEPPAYAHVPLLPDHTGERLAKRHASLSLRELRQAGVKAEAVTGFLAAWAGLRDGGPDGFALLTPRDLLPGFNFASIKTGLEPLPEDLPAVLRAV
ncbi:MAG: tRNA glutamyl-Q(34) synthetase GluQRS [Deltaproteobacteria bacterium]|jgi:glutamyl-tRNA synthetase|nr:tRNA glutamyl-Q(34) synthetase GluQRS [Deltaproteobacteria bacterium]